MSFLKKLLQNPEKTLTDAFKVAEQLAKDVEAQLDPVADRANEKLEKLGTKLGRAMERTAKRIEGIATHVEAEINGKPAPTAPKADVEAPAAAPVVTTAPAAPAVKAKKVTPTGEKSKTAAAIAKKPATAKTATKPAAKKAAPKKAPKP